MKPVNLPTRWLGLAGALALAPASLSSCLDSDAGSPGAGEPLIGSVDVGGNGGPAASADAARDAAPDGGPADAAVSRDAYSFPDVEEPSADADAAPADVGQPGPQPIRPRPEELDVALGPGETVGDVLERFAPVWYHDTATGGPDGSLGAKQDYFSTLDFDGELQHDNNWESLVTHDIHAVIYYALVTTETHHFLTWSQYHSRDWEDTCLGLTTACHEGDMESVHMVVERAPEGLGRPVLVISGAHGIDYTWADEGSPMAPHGRGPLDYESEAGQISATFDEAHTHVRLFTQAKGHGPIPCRAREVEPFGSYRGFWPSGVRCIGAPYDHEDGFPGGDGIVNRYSGGFADPWIPGLDEAVATVRYGFVDYLTRIWPHRHETGDGLLFSSGPGAGGPLRYQGARNTPPFAFEARIGVRFDPDQFLIEGGGNAAWHKTLPGTAQGDLFFDPALAISRRFTPPPPFSLDYTYNPYIYPERRP